MYVKRIELWKGSLKTLDITIIELGENDVLRVQLPTCGGADQLPMLATGFGGL